MQPRSLWDILRQQAAGLGQALARLLAGSIRSPGGESRAAGGSAPAGSPVQPAPGGQEPPGAEPEQEELGIPGPARHSGPPAAWLEAAGSKGPPAAWLEYIRQRLAANPDAPAAGGDRLSADGDGFSAESAAPEAGRDPPPGEGEGRLPAAPSAPEGHALRIYPAARPPGEGANPPGPRPAAESASQAGPAQPGSIRSTGGENIRSTGGEATARPRKTRPSIPFQAARQPAGPGEGTARPADAAARPASQPAGEPAALPFPAPLAEAPTGPHPPPRPGPGEAARQSPPPGAEPQGETAGRRLTGEETALPASPQPGSFENPVGWAGWPTPTPTPAPPPAGHALPTSLTPGGVRPAPGETNPTSGGTRPAPAAEAGESPAEPAGSYGDYDDIAWLSAVVEPPAPPPTDFPEGGLPIRSRFPAASVLNAAIRPPLSTSSPSTQVRADTQVGPYPNSSVFADLPAAFGDLNSAPGGPQPTQAELEAFERTRRRLRRLEKEQQGQVWSEFTF